MHLWPCGYRNTKGKIFYQIGDLVLPLYDSNFCILFSIDSYFIVIILAFIFYSFTIYFYIIVSMEFPSSYFKLLMIHNKK